MKKILLLSAFFIITSNVFSQGVRIGLNFSPGLAFNNATETTTSNPHLYSLSTAGKGSGFRFIGGPEIYFFLGNQFAITTGVWYAAMREGFTYTSNGVKATAVYNLQYLQLPVTMRMFTNEIMTNTRIYFQLGGAFDIKLAAKNYKVDSLASTVITKFRPFDASLILGTGLEFKLGESNYLMLGVRYTRGLINSVTKVNPDVLAPFSNVTAIKSTANLFSLDVGIRF